MRIRTRSTVALAIAGALSLAAVPLAGGASAGSSERSGQSRTVSFQSIGLSSDGTRLSGFSLRAPQLAVPLAKVNGMSWDTKLVGIDYRVQDGALYGVGNQGGVYTLAPRTGKATKVNRLTVALSGHRFGVDFNPAADRLRIISDTGQNLRHNVNAGGTTLVDGTLAYTAGTAAQGVTAAAYTNNDVNAATGTNLFDIDTTLDQVVAQVPANDGTLAVSGPLGVRVDRAGFDIVSSVRGGLSVGNAGYAVLRLEGSKSSALYRVDLLSGNAVKVGTFLLADVADLAIVTPR